MEEWFKNEIIKIEDLAKEEDQLKGIIKSKNLLLRLVKEQEVRDVKDLIKRNVDVIKFSNMSKKYIENKRKCSDAVNDLLEKMLDSGHIFLTNVVQCGTMTYAWSISFSKKNKDFVLEVPEEEGIDINHFEEANRGKFALYRKNGIIQDLITHSYDFNIIKDAFKEEVKNGV